MQPTDLRAFAQRYADAWCSQNAASVAAFFSPEGSLKVNDAAASVGRKAITEEAQGFMTAFPDMRVSFDKLGQDGERVLFHWTLVGTNTGPGGAGKKVRISGHESWRFGPDRLVAESLGHFDPAEYARQLAQGA